MYTHHLTFPPSPVVKSFGRRLKEWDHGYKRPKWVSSVASSESSESSYRMERCHLRWVSHLIRTPSIWLIQLAGTWWNQNTLEGLYTVSYPAWERLRVPPPGGTGEWCSPEGRLSCITQSAATVTQFKTNGWMEFQLDVISDSSPHRVHCKRWNSTSHVFSLYHTSKHTMGHVPIRCPD